MDELFSLAAANGLFAVLFCGLLVYQLRDSRVREAKYSRTIRDLTDRLSAVVTVKADTREIKRGVEQVGCEVCAVKADTKEIKLAVAAQRARKGAAPQKCAEGT